MLHVKHLKIAINEVVVSMLGIHHEYENLTKTKSNPFFLKSEGDWSSHSGILDPPVQNQLKQENAHLKLALAQRYIYGDDQSGRIPQLLVLRHRHYSTSVRHDFFIIYSTPVELTFYHAFDCICYMK